MSTTNIAKSLGAAALNLKAARQCMGMAQRCNSDAECNTSCEQLCECVNETCVPKCKSDADCAIFGEGIVGACVVPKGALEGHCEFPASTTTSS